MNNIKISRLLFIAFAIPLLALAGLIWTSVTQMDVINNQSTEIAQNWLPSVAAVEKLNTQTADLRNIEAIHIITVDENEFAAVEQQLDKTESMVNDTLNQYQKLVSSSEEQRILDQFKAEYQSYLSIQKELLQLSRENQNQKARNLFLGASLTSYNQYSDLLLKLVALNEKGSNDASARGDEIYQQSEVILITVLVVSGLIVAGIGIIVARYLTNSINQVQQAMNKLAKGDLTYRLTVQGNNELAMLADGFNQSSQQFQQLNSGLIKVADQVNSLADSLSANMNQTEHNSSQMLAQVEMVATAITEMASAAQEISQNASSARDSANEALSSVDVGHKSLDKSNHIASRIEQSMSESATIVNELKLHSTEIGAVIDVINGISEQTNLLALNAAIEAARAGEQGRGFAVVADEVRNLAAKTQQSTVDIKEIITQLQSQAEQADQFMQSNLGLINESQQMSEQVSEAFSHIATAVNSISEINNLVATASNEQTSVTDEISMNIATTVDMVNQNVSAIADATEMTESLSANARDQKQQLAYFKI